MIRKVERADGARYQVYAQKDGRKVYVGSFESKREAQSADEDHRVTQRKIAAGELPRAVDTKRTFAVAVALWLKHLEDTSSRSAVEYRSRVDNHLLPAFRDVPIVDIRRNDVIRWRDGLNIGLLTPSTVNTVLGTLSSAFTFFVEQEWIDKNPAHRVRKLKTKTKVFPWLESPEVITRLLGECTPNIRNLVAVLVGTGMRLDEALHLRWDDVDLDHRIITVHRGKKGTTKSGRMRRVPIFNSVLVVLREMRLARGNNTLLWPGANVGRPLSQPAVRVPFKVAAEHAELPKALRLHDLRHSFASLFLIDGGDIFKLSKILGHGSVMITERTYAHLKPTAYEEDYDRVAFKMPNVGRVVPFSVVQ
ncbi:MAG: tyrosine-type recombinase/integrase [Proteobacteria bacterium]|nr:tyrosine-type recombinase/integrase [Pseudomonadota bacterium]